MPIIRSVVAFQGFTGLPDDVYLNTFHFEIAVGPVEPADIASIGAALDNFWVGDPAGTPSALMTYYPASGLSGQPHVDHYLIDEDTGASGSPIGYSDFLGSFVPGNGVPLPSEVALCMSFHGDLTDVPEESDEDGPGPIPGTRPASRRRGRVFLGPLSVDALAPTGKRPQSFLMQTVQDRGAALMNDAGLAARGIDWVVWSPTTDSAHAVTGGWVDDAFDTQRRRGLAPSQRLVF